MAALVAALNAAGSIGGEQVTFQRTVHGPVVATTDDATMARTAEHLKENKIPLEDTLLSHLLALSDLEAQLIDVATGSRIGVREVMAELLHEFRMGGSQYPAYYSIVAAGANAIVAGAKG